MAQKKKQVDRYLIEGDEIINCQTGEVKPLPVGWQFLMAVIMTWKAR